MQSSTSRIGGGVAAGGVGLRAELAQQADLDGVERVKHRGCAGGWTSGGTACRRGCATVNHRQERRAGPVELGCDRAHIRSRSASSGTGRHERRPPACRPCRPSCGRCRSPPATTATARTSRAARPGRPGSAPMNPPRAVPTPYQLGSRCRFYVHANTHGMARRFSTRIQRRRPRRPRPAAATAASRSSTARELRRSGLETATKYEEKSGFWWNEPPVAASDALRQLPDAASSHTGFVARLRAAAPRPPRGSARAPRPTTRSRVAPPRSRPQPVTLFDEPRPAPVMRIRPCRVPAGPPITAAYVDPPPRLAVPAPWNSVASTPMEAAGVGDPLLRQEQLPVGRQVGPPSFVRVGGPDHRGLPVPRSLPRYTYSGSPSRARRVAGAPRRSSMVSNGAQGRCRSASRAPAPSHAPAPAARAVRRARG